MLVVSLIRASNRSSIQIEATWFESKDASFCLTAAAAGGLPKRRRDPDFVIKMAIISGAVTLFVIVFLALLYCCYKRVKKKYSTIKMPPSIQFYFQSTLDSTVRASREHLTAKPNGKLRTKSH